MKYEVIYQSVNGCFSLPSRTLKEANADKARIVTLAKTPGHAAWGIKIVKL